MYVEDLSDGAPTPLEDGSFKLPVRISIERMFGFVNGEIEHMFVAMGKNLTTSRGMLVVWITSNILLYIILSFHTSLHIHNSYKRIYSE